VSWFLSLSQFKKRAPRALREIKKFAQVNMGTEDVRIDVRLNQHVWSKGVRYVPRRVRVRLSRRKNEDEEKGGDYYTLVEHVERVTSFKKLETTTVDES
jgi:large subunit ribosomal protein L31e